MFIWCRHELFVNLSCTRNCFSRCVHMNPSNTLFFGSLNICSSRVHECFCSCRILCFKITHPTPSKVNLSTTYNNGLLPGVLSFFPKKSLGLPAKPKKIPGPKFNPPKKIPMPILWSFKVPGRGNAVTQRKTLEIEHLCLFIHHTI